MNPLGEFSYTSTETGENKTLRCLFAPVDQGGGEIFVMGTIQDISAETALKKQLAEEEANRQDDMRNLFEVMQVDQKTLGNFIEDANYEFNRAKETLQNEYIPIRQKLIKLYQSIHAIKSNALIVDLSGYGAKLHAFESQIKALQGKDEKTSIDDIQQLNEELEKQIEGKEKLTEIIMRLKSFNTASDIGKDETFVNALRQAGERVAKDENKKLDFIVEAFDKEALDRGPQRVMKDILTQLIRNSVHHGIEMPKERKRLSKSETGIIKLSITIKNSMINMRLSDDGKGLDFDFIAQQAKSQGLLNNIPAEKIDRQFLSNIIFSPGFSTSETEDIHAGRGIGLNLVKDRLREVKGKIGIQSKKGQGLTFDIQIPLT
jgi:two-component system chemotaxis sensor kinase CheA